MADYIGDDETDLLPPLTDEEQAQLAGLRPPGLQAGAGPMPSASVSTAQQPPPITGPANARLQEVLGERPVLTQPHWWQRLAGAAAGGAAGWSNASGRTRNPIDIDQLTQNILAPGYNSKLAEWQSRVAPLEQQAQLETAKNQAWWKNAGAQAGIDQKAAEAEMQRQHGQYFENRSKQEQNQWKIGAGGKLYNTITGESKDAPETPEDRFKTAKALGVDDDGAKFYALNKKLPEAKEHNTNEWQMYLDASGGDPKKAIAAWREDKINVAKQSRPVVNVGTGDEVLDEEAINQAADAVNAGAGLPSLGFGKQSAALRIKILNRAAQRKPGNDLAGAKQDFAASTGAIKDMERNFSRIRISEGTAERNLDLADTVSKRVDRAGSPILNKYLLYLKGQVAGDDDTQLLDNAVETAANEYAGVVTAGSGGGVAATDSSRQHARDMLHSSMAKGTFSKVVAQMKQEMGNRRASFEESLKGARAGRGGATMRRYVSNGTTYNIPSSQEGEFLKDHPGAKPQ